MKKIILGIMIAVVSFSLEAQTVAVVDFMKVPGGGQAAYLAVEKQWKALHQSRVESGKIIGWELYAIWNTGSGSAYNYATVTIFDKFSKLENALTEADLRKAFGSSFDDLVKKTGESRSLVYSETFHLETGINSNTPDKYIVINSIQTNNVGTYINMENVAYKPMQEEAKKAGLRNSWGIWTRWPMADNTYQAVAVDGYTKFENIGGGNYGELMEKVLAGKKAADISVIMEQINKTDEIRKIVKSEIWEMLDSTTPKK